jgi:hypothetical protein
MKIDRNPPPGSTFQREECRHANGIHGSRCGHQPGVILLGALLGTGK